VVGFGLFVCSVTFITAVQVIATSRSGLAMTVLGLMIVVLLYAGSAWLPYLLYLSSPEATTRRLRALNGWLVAHGSQLYLSAIVVGGVVVTINGASTAIVTLLCLRQNGPATIAIRPITTLAARLPPLA
jgi:hypothetical protein